MRVIVQELLNGASQAGRRDVFRREGDARTELRDTSGDQELVAALRYDQQRQPETEPLVDAVHAAVGHERARALEHAQLRHELADEDGGGRGWAGPRRRGRSKSASATVHRRTPRNRPDRMPVLR